MELGKLTIVAFFIACAVGCSKPGEKIPIGGGDVHAEDREKYGLHANTSLWGQITDEGGEPLKGIAVTDGYSVTTTDSEGIYQLVGHAKARFVYYTTPAEFAIRVDDGNHPSFYAKINKATSLFRQDFKLTPATKSEKWTLICVGDPQTSTYDNVERFINESLADIDRTALELKNEGETVYAPSIGSLDLHHVSIYN